MLRMSVLKMLWSKALPMSLLLALGAARGVDKLVEGSTECLCDEEKVEMFNAVQLMNSAVKLMNHTLTDCTKLRAIHEEEFLRRENIGQSWKYPAYSCREIADRKPESSSGYYWVQTCRQSPPVQVYCDLERVLDSSRGWMRVANLDMTDPHQQCPAGFTFISSPRRVCGKGTSSRGCSSVTFETMGVQYQKVCGRVLGYQFYSPDAFRQRHNCPSPCGIDDTYVDGVSITHGSLPRKHVWTYAAGLVELEHDRNQCPCSSVPGAQPPDFVGSDYYCESGLYTRPWRNLLYASDVLWDGQRCDGYEGPCCSPPNLPWFCKDLPEPTVDDLEVRVCSDDGGEDTPIEVVELYIQ